jgi:hypothetical protein
MTPTTVCVTFPVEWATQTAPQTMRRRSLDGPRSFALRFRWGGAAELQRKRGGPAVQSVPGSVSLLA